MVFSMRQQIVIGPTPPGTGVMTDAFGIVAMIAMTPLITIQVLGLYERKQHKKMMEEYMAREREKEQQAAIEKYVNEVLEKKLEKCLEEALGSLLK